MKGFVLIVLLISVGVTVCGQEDSQKVSQSTCVLEDITKYPDAKSLEDALLKGQLNSKCNRNYSDDLQQLMISSKKFDECYTAVAQEILKDSQSSSGTKDYRTIVNASCSHAAKLGDCFITYISRLPHLTLYQGRPLPISNLSEALIKFFCTNDGAQERLYLFLTDGLTCLESRSVELNDCRNISFPNKSRPQRQENTLLFTEDSCKRLSELEKCMKDEVLKCSQSNKVDLIDYFEELKSTVEQIYTPCPASQKSEKENVV